MTIEERRTEAAKELRELSSMLVRFQAEYGTKHYSWSSRCDTLEAGLKRVNSHETARAASGKASAIANEVFMAEDAFRMALNAVVDSPKLSKMTKEFSGVAFQATKVQGAFGNLVAEMGLEEI